MSTVHTPLVLHEHANLSDALSLWLGFLNFGGKLLPFQLPDRLHLFFVALNAIAKPFKYPPLVGATCVSDR